MRTVAAILAVFALVGAATPLRADAALAGFHAGWSDQDPWPRLGGGQATYTFHYRNTASGSSPREIVDWPDAPG